MPLRINYDVTVDATYIYLDRIAPGGAHHTYECDPIAVDGMINLDFTEDGRLLGIEILGASSKLPPALLASVRQVST